jgi:uncharacterized protein (DUF2236 family)
MSYLVQPGSIVRRVWGDADSILLVFAGSAAEFALNRAVDWLFVTGALPADPIGRFFTTASYAQSIAFGDRETAQRALDTIRSAHAAVERRRGGRIPAWAHRDVLYMLVDYSERAFRALHRPLTGPEREELWLDFLSIGHGLGIPQLPTSYAEWREDRVRHLERDLAFSDLTERLYDAYRLHLGAWRFALLLHVQGALVPPRVRHLLRLPRAWLRPAFALHSALVELGLRDVLRPALVPPEHRAAVERLDRHRLCTESSWLSRSARSRRQSAVDDRRC